MSTPFPSSLSEYQRGARAVGAKSALPLAVAAAGLASTAHGQVIVYTPTTNNVAQLGSAHQDVFIDLIQGQVGYASFNSYDIHLTTRDNSGGSDPDNLVTGIMFNYIGRGTLDGYGGKFADQPGGQSNGGFGYLGKFSRGTTVDGSLFGDAYPYLNPGTAGVAPTWSSSAGYAAIEFTRNNNTYYGWLKLGVNADGSQVSVLAFGYNQTAGTSIAIGEGLAAVPEPANVAALLAAGAAGLAVYRRRKQIVRAA